MTVPLQNLYQLTPKDQAGVLWSPFHRRVSTASGAASPILSPVITAGLDQLLFVTNIQAVAQPGFGLSVVRLSVQIEDQVGNNLSFLVDDRFVGAVDVIDSIDRQLDVILIGIQHSLRALVTFSGTNIANTVRLEVSGYLTPRGNVALF